MILTKIQLISLVLLMLISCTQRRYIPFDATEVQKINDFHYVLSKSLMNNEDKLDGYIEDYLTALITVDAVNICKGKGRFVLINKTLTDGIRWAAHGVSERELRRSNFEWGGYKNITIEIKCETR